MKDPLASFLHQPLTRGLTLRMPLKQFIYKELRKARASSDSKTSKIDLLFPLRR
jgi:hypothetical protein